MFTRTLSRGQSISWMIVTSHIRLFTSGNSSRRGFHRHLAPFSLVDDDQVRVRRSIYSSSSHLKGQTGDEHIHRDGEQTERVLYDDEFEDLPRYEDHIPTNQLQKTLLTFGSAAAALLDPYRDDMVAVLGETTGDRALARMKRTMEASEEGRAILADCPRISSATLDLRKLRSLPDGTLGREYSRFLDVNKVSPDTRRPVHFVDDPQLAYVMQRYREGHDFVHALLTMPTNVLGEVVVKWVEALQTDLPMCWAAAILGPLQIKSSRARRHLLDVYLPWAFECGHVPTAIGTLPLFSVYFERRLEQPVTELREELGIPQVPLIPVNRATPPKS